MRIDNNRSFFEIWLPERTTLKQLFHDDGLFYWTKSWSDIDYMCWKDNGFIIEVRVKTEYLDEFCKILNGIDGNIVYDEECKKQFEKDNKIL